MGDNKPEFLWRGPCTHVQICERVSSKHPGLCSPQTNSVLLDDCLAAVDSHVARHIFGEPRRIRLSESILTVD